MANPVRFGIMGCADIAPTICQAIAQVPHAAAVAAVGSRSSEKARRFVADNGLPASTRAHGSYEALLDDAEVDAVYMPLPTSLHVRWATAAARKGKHVLLEKPAALCAADLDRILEACAAAGVQFMDGTMWLHHPRTASMWSMLSDPTRFGHSRLMNSTVCFHADTDFLQNNIRVKPDLDSLGALGDAGWYCIGAILWANGYELPKAATAFPSPAKNDAGVILSCGASLHWQDGRVATFLCSFTAHLSFDMTVVGTKGRIHLTDFVVPFQKPPRFTFTELHNGGLPLSAEHAVDAALTQEAHMVSEFSRLVGRIRESGSEPDERWPEITRKTQIVVDAVKASIDRESQPVEVIF